LALSKVVHVLDGVVARFEGIILNPVLEGWVVRAIFLVAIIERGGWSRNEWDIPYPGKQGSSWVGGAHTMNHGFWDGECRGVGSDGRCGRGEAAMEVGGEEFVDAVEGSTPCWVVE